MNYLLDILVPFKMSGLSFHKMSIFRYWGKRRTHVIFL